MEFKFTQADLEVVSEEMAYDGFFKLKKLKVRHKLFQGGWSKIFDRELVVRHDAVGALLYDPRLQKFAMVEQVRMGAIGRETSPWLLELVAGIVDKEDEDKTDLVRRESVEEAGLDVSDIEHMLDYFVSPGGSSECFSLFCAHVDLEGVETGIFGLDEEHENIKLHILPVQQLADMLQEGKINNSMTIMGLQWFFLNRESIDAKWL